MSLLRSTSRAAATLAALALGAPLALAQPANQDAILDGLYKAVSDAGEKELVIYNPNTNANQPIFDAFAKRFPGIAITGVDLYGPKLTTRLEAEKASGNIAADVIYTTANEMPSFAESGFLVSYLPELAEGLDDKYIGTDNMWQDWTLTVGGMFYNKAFLKPEDAPKGYVELTDKKYDKALSISTLQSVSGTGQALTTLTLKGTLDRAFFEALAANHPVVSQANAQAIQAVATGQATIGLDVPYHFFKAAIAKGAPFTFIWPEEGVMSIPLNEALVNGAPHPAAAKLFVNWLFSTEAQELLAEIGMQSPMPGAPTVKDAPEGLTFNVIDWRTLVAEYPAQLEMYKEVFAN